MKKIYEKIQVVYFYDSLEERNSHVSEMELQGWESSSRIRYFKLVDDIPSFEYVGEYVKYM